MNFLIVFLYLLGVTFSAPISNEGNRQDPLVNTSPFAVPIPGSINSGSGLGSPTGANGDYGGPDGSMIQPQTPPQQEYGTGISIPCSACAQIP